MSRQIMLPTISNIKEAFHLEASEAEEETLVVELAHFLARKQTLIIFGNDRAKPFRRTPEGKHIITSGVVSDMLNLASFDDGGAIPTLFGDLFADLEVESLADDILGYEEPIPYSLTQ